MIPSVYIYIHTLRYRYIYIYMYIHIHIYIYRPLFLFLAGDVMAWRDEKESLQLGYGLREAEYVYQVK